MEAEFLLLEGEFTIRKDGELLNYTKISDIPEKFDHVIRFLPNIPEAVSYTHLTLPTIYSV